MSKNPPPIKEFMELAFQAAQYSTCARRRVGAVIINGSGQVISTGWNHSTNGISCEAKFFGEYARDVYPDTAEFKMFLKALQEVPFTAHSYEKYLSPELSSVWESFKIYTKTPEFKERHMKFMDQEIHSEVSAILNAYKMGKSVQNCILFSSRSPCIDCAKAMIEAGITKCYYTETSEKGLSGGLALLDEVIGVEHLPIETEYYT